MHRRFSDTLGRNHELKIKRYIGGCTEHKSILPKMYTRTPVQRTLYMYNAHVLPI